MKTIFYIFLFLFFSTTIFCQQGWYQLTSGTSNNLRSVCFTDVNTGYAAGYNGTILKTTNGGLNWFAQQTGTIENINSIYFIGQTGFAVGGINKPVILKTTDGGAAWINISISGNYRLNSVFMTNISNVHSCGGGKIIKTTTGGLNWNVQNFDSASLLIFRGFRTIFFTDTLNGFAGGFTQQIGHYIGLFMKTNNGGINWYQAGPQGYLTSIYFINTATGYATSTTYGSCCPTNFISKTTTGGNNWIYTDSIGSNSHFNSVSFVNSTSGYAAGFTSFGNSLIIKTSDSGIIWFVQVTPPADTLNSIFLINANTGYAVGNAGTMLKTTNGGVSILEPLGNEIPKEFKLYQNYPNPFNPVTKIRFSLPLPSEGRVHRVKLKIFDILGRELATLVNEELKPGTYEVEFDASSYSSGIYYYILEVNRFSKTNKMVLLR